MEYLTGEKEFDDALQERFARATPRVQQLLSGNTIDLLLASLGNLFDLDAETEEQVGQEIALVLLAVEPIEEFETNLVVEALVPPEKAEQIARFVQEKIFAPVADDIQPEGGGGIPPPPAPQAPQPPTPPAWQQPQPAPIPPPAPPSYPPPPQPMPPPPYPHQQMPAPAPYAPPYQQVAPPVPPQPPAEPSFYGPPARKPSYNAMLDTPRYGGGAPQPASPWENLPSEQPSAPQPQYTGPQWTHALHTPPSPRPGGMDGAPHNLPSAPAPAQGGRVFDRNAAMSFDEPRRPQSPN